MRGEISLPHISPNEICVSFSDMVKEYMKVKGYTQSELVKSSTLPKTVISRVLQNTNHKGKSYSPSYMTVLSICYGLKLNQEETIRLLLAAYPEIGVCLETIQQGKDIYETNKMLYECGLSLLGSSEE